MESAKQCVCGKNMTKQDTGIVLASSPPQYPMQWRCECGNVEDAGIIMDKNIIIGVKTVFLQRILDEKILCGDVSIEATKNLIANQWILTMKASVLGNTLYDHKVTYPKDWKEALKERWLPRWMLKKYPVEYTTHHYMIEELYPHLNVAWPEKEPVLKVHTSQLNLKD